MPCDSQVTVTNKLGERFDVPCGKCPPCKLRRVQGWVFRLQQEEMRSLCAHFVTFTYNTDHVPISKNGFRTLDKSHPQNFFKRLRKLTPHPIKYYLVGEYGTINKRPHYHAIIFNVENTSLYAEAWSINGKQLGDVFVAQVSGASIAYTLKYIDKPSFKRSFSRDDRLPEFPLMSKGLGENYITDATKAYHNSDLHNNFLTEKGGHKIALPKYYRDRLYDEKTRKIQTIKIIDIVNKQQNDEQEKYIRRNFPTDLDNYDNIGRHQRHLEQLKHERFRKFYHRQKTRD